MNRVHQAAIVVDGLQISNWSREVFQEIKRGGVSAINATCAVWENAAETMRAIAQWLEILNANADLVFLAENSDDILRAKREERIAIFLGFQNGSPFEDDFRYVELFHRMGVRVGQITYNNQNALGGGCFEANDSGLSRFGRVVVSEMNRVGMLIDLSHVGQRTTLDAIEASAQPVAITHANPDWFHATPRNKTALVMQSLVAKGGVMGCSLYPTVSGGEHVTVESFCSMMLRMVDDLGEDHVALGSDCTRGWQDDFVGWLRNGRWKPVLPGQEPTWPAWPRWFRGPEDFPRITDGLLAAGMPESTVLKILGGNWQRLFGEVMDTNKETTKVHTFNQKNHPRNGAPHEHNATATAS